MKLYYCFPQGHFKALTLSYDDGKIEDRRLIEIFNKNKIKATFNLNYGIMAYEDTSSLAHPRLPLSEVPELYKGHEIATHTMTHPTIARCPLPYIANEILEDRKGLEKITGQIIRGHAYPNGSYSSEIKQLCKDLGIAYARVVETTENFELPSDPYEWKGTCHHDNPRLMELAKEFAEFKKSQYLKLMYVWGHSYEFEDNNNWNVIEEFCEYIGQRDDIWYCTNIEFTDYMEAAKRLIFNADTNIVYNPSAISVWIKLQQNSNAIVEIKSGETVNLLNI